MSLFAGARGGLLGVMWHGLVSDPWLARVLPAGAGPRQQEPLSQMIAFAAARTGAGVVLGALYWASWGLIAIVAMPWYVVGAAFGLLCWAGAVLPALSTLRMTGSVAVNTLRVHAVEWLATCVAVGLACAYAWQRPAWPGHATPVQRTESSEHARRRGGRVTGVGRREAHQQHVRLFVGHRAMLHAFGITNSSPCPRVRRLHASGSDAAAAQGRNRRVVVLVPDELSELTTMMSRSLSCATVPGW
jgi:hypothetical protein